MAANTVRVEIKDNNILDRVIKHPYFAPILDQLPLLLDPSTFIGFTPNQVTHFLKEENESVVNKYIAKIKATATQLEI